MDRPALDAWLAAYFGAWGSNDAAGVARLFAEDARYWTGPYDEPLRGRDAIVTAWTGGGPPASFRPEWRVLAIDDSLAVAWWRVRERRRPEEPEVEYDGILVLRFDAAGRCTEHREWFVRRPGPSGS